MEYGARRGIHRILEVLARQEIRASVLVCAVLAERYPDMLRAAWDRIPGRGGTYGEYLRAVSDILANVPA